MFSKLDLQFVVVLKFDFCLLRASIGFYPLFRTRMEEFLLCFSTDSSITLPITTSPEPSIEIFACLVVILPAEISPLPFITVSKLSRTLSVSFAFKLISPEPFTVHLTLP